MIGVNEHYDVIYVLTGDADVERRLYNMNGISPRMLNDPCYRFESNDIYAYMHVEHERDVAFIVNVDIDASRPHGS